MSHYPVFLINLDRQAQRLRLMQAQLAEIGVPVERIRAFDGSNPAEQATAVAAPYAPLTGGEIGCFESHRRFWRRVVEEDLPGAFVLEDDMALASDFASLEFPAHVLPSAHLIKIDESRPRDSAYGTEQLPAGPGRHLVRMLGSEMSTGCYFVTQTGARLLLERSQDYYLPVDIFLFYRESKVFRELEVWKLCDAAAAQLHMISPNETLAPDFQDRIQGAARPEQEKSLSALWKMTRFRARRLIEGDTRRQRERRAQQHLDRFMETQPVTRGQIRFQSPSWDHLQPLLPGADLTKSAPGLKMDR